MLEQGAVVVEKDFGAIIEPTPIDHFVERELIDLAPTDGLIVIKILGLHGIMTVVGEVDAHDIKQSDVGAVGISDVLERDGALRRDVMSVRSNPLAAGNVDPRDAIIAVLFAGG